VIVSDTTKRDRDPGVPEALPRTLIRLRERLGVETLDRLWIFPPVCNGRREQGLVAVSTFEGGGDRRSMITVAYQAEHTGRGITVVPTFTREGGATPDRFPRVMQGVVRRGGEEKGEPREVEIGGSAERFEELLEEFDALFLGAREP
jgi:hypothetical protein